MATVRFEHVSQRSRHGVDTVADLDLEVADGELLVVSGPSGSGTSAALHLLAGFDDVSDGTIWIGDRCVNGVGPRERNVATVFGSQALYPHLTVAGNLARPLDVAGVPEWERAQRVHDVAAVLDLTGLLDRRPSTLTGAQRRHLVLGRALVRRPDVLVMDEPWSGLDRELRGRLCADVAELQRSTQTTMLYATHDPVEAMAIGDRVAVMHRGVLQQVATPAELSDRPANVVVAGFVGAMQPVTAAAHPVRQTGCEAVHAAARRA